MKRGIIIIFVSIALFLLSSSTVQTQDCTWQPACDVTVQDCGCGGTQTRATVCDGGCGEWYACSVSDVETDCTDGADNDCDNLIDCDDTDCSASTVCDVPDDETDNVPDCEDGEVQECGEGGLGVCSTGTKDCVNEVWSACTMYLPSTEICDGLDNDCDGETDEGCDASTPPSEPPAECEDGDTRECGTDVGNCQKGRQVCTSGAWGECEGGVRPLQEQCGNNEDDNCDGRVDESCEIKELPEAVTQEQIIVDQEKENLRDSLRRSTDREQTEEGTGRECIDKDGDGYGQNCQKSFDCNDDDPDVHPGAQEICNNRDEDCNNQIDDHLTRDCGDSNVGACSTGKEQCREGRWMGCTAKYPNPERCGNRIDDDCDGEVDEDCEEKNLSVSRKALRRALDARFGQGKYDETSFVKKQQTTNRFINMKKKSVIAHGKTKIHIKVIPIQGLKNFTIYEEIPKSIAQSTKDIVFSIEPEVLEDDPLVAWHFSELVQPTEITYEVAGEHEDAHEQTSTTTIAEETAALDRSWLFNLIPLMIIPILGLAFVFLVQMAHRRE